MFTQRVQGKFTIDSTTDQVQSTGGIVLAAKISEKIGLIFSDNKSKQQLAHPEILKVMYGLFVQGRNSFEEIKCRLSNNNILEKALLPI